MEPIRFRAGPRIRPRPCCFCACPREGIAVMVLPHCNRRWRKILLVVVVMSLLRPIIIPAMIIASLGAMPMVASSSAAPLSVSVGGSSSENVAVPSRPELLQLLHLTLVSLDLANRTGNYTVFRQMAAPSFQDANSVEKLAARFKAWRQAGIDLTALVLREPKFTRAPAVDEHGLLTLTGLLPGPTQQVKFALTYARDDRDWKLYALTLTTGTSTSGGRKRLDNSEPAWPQS